MVDFKKMVTSGSGGHPLDPMELYRRLDRASDKGELRKVQEAVLTEWHAKRRNLTDVIVKLHTGQGKTLIGLIILQSKLNEKCGPALYLCPDNFLVEQTAMQARQFGFVAETIAGGDDLPSSFLESQGILVTSAKKLFNGMTKFGLRGLSQSVGALVMDDVHACIDEIRAACAIRLPATSQGYKDLVGLFGEALQSQGYGTHADLLNGEYDALLPVPYWDWIDRVPETAHVLARNANSQEVRFAWPLIRDILADCDCVVSGTSLEIAPRFPPLNEFGSYASAKHRVFMSATVSDDSFLLKGLGLAAESVRTPLTTEEKWSGEKMVLIPALISEDLNRGEVVEMFAKPAKGREHGVVALTPSFKASTDWEKYGATLATSVTIEREVERLKRGECEVTLVVANRYDGIDLPDSACRVLVIDSRPYGESLFERYIEKCLPNSSALAVRVARTIEQGMGRSVRGEKDYSVVVVIGPSLVRFLRMPASRDFLSPQTRQQIEIGLAIAKAAEDEVDQGRSARLALTGLVSQCLKRDDGWKDYYVQQMDTIGAPAAEPKRLDVFGLELRAESAARDGQFEEAANLVQKICDEWVTDEAERGWYLQEKARHQYRLSKVRSEQTQAAAHRKNRFLLRPATRAGTTVILPFAQKRLEQILSWIKAQGDTASLAVAVQAIVSDLRFGVAADAFEAALQELGLALGFSCERPDKEWKEGPDNLWRVKEDRCLVIECKSDVSVQRKTIERRESDQMNRSYAWFNKEYPGVQSECVMVIPAKKLARGAGLLQPTRGLAQSGLERLGASARAFFNEFVGQDLQALSEQNIGQALERHKLRVDDLLGSYTIAIKEAGLPQ